MAIAATGQLNLQELPSHGSRTLDSFHKLEQIGEGTYAQVYKAREKETGEIVALKKIRMENEKEGFPITAIREIKILQKLHHKNVVKMKEIVACPDSEKDEKGRPGSIYMVFEYMDHDLAGLIRRAAVFSVPQIKCYMRQLLTGLHYCHVNQVLHRDIKGANLLIDNKGTLKLADFGLARFFSNEHNGNLTNRVITLWYRPPELLMGSTKYGPAVDMWSVGCIFAELLNGKPLFTGKDEAEQIFKIFELCGAPDESKWPDVKKLPWYSNLKPNRPLKRRLREHFRLVDRHALDLLDKMLVLNPVQRISTLAALDAEYFWADPLPCDPQSLPKYETSHEFQTKQKRQHHRQHEDIGKRSKFQHPQSQTCLLPIQQSGEAQAQAQAQAQAHSWRLTGSYQQQRQYEKFQHRPAHTVEANVHRHSGPSQQQRQDEEAQKHHNYPAPSRPIPGQHSGQINAQRQGGPNHPMHGSQAPAPFRYSQGGNFGEGHTHPNQERRGYGNSSCRQHDHRGGNSGGFESKRNYDHQYGGR